MMDITMVLVELFIRFKNAPLLSKILKKSCNKLGKVGRYFEIFQKLFILTQIKLTEISH